MKRALAYPAAIIGFLLLQGGARAEDYTITIRGNQFVPRELVIPANRKLSIIINNTEPSPAEFESYDLNREKVVASNHQIVVFIGPLDPGKYEYFDDFRRETTKSIITAK